MDKSRISLHIITPVVTDFYHCMHCEQFFQVAGIGQQVRLEGREEYPDELKEECARLADRIFEWKERYQDRIQVQVIDPQSAQGFLLSLRHWARRYPAFIVNNRKVASGSDWEAVERVLQATVLTPS